MQAKSKRVIRTREGDMVELLRGLNALLDRLEERGLTTPLEPLKRAEGLEQRIRDHARRFAHEHEAQLRRDEKADELERAASDVRPLAYVAQEAREVQAQGAATIALHDARRTGLAVLRGELPPPSRTMDA